MKHQQKDLLLQDFYKTLAAVDSYTANLQEYCKFKEWVRLAIVEHTKLDMFVLSNSKDRILIKFKDYLTFSQKDLMNLVQPYADRIYNDSLCEISTKRKAGERWYKIDRKSPKYNDFLLGVGMMDDFFVEGRAINSSWHHKSLEAFITDIRCNIFDVKNYNTKFCVQLYDTLSYNIDINSIVDIKDMCGKLYYFDNMEFQMSLLSMVGIDKVKEAILKILDSEKSK